VIVSSIVIDQGQGKLADVEKEIAELERVRQSASAMVIEADAKLDRLSRRRRHAGWGARGPALRERPVHRELDAPLKRAAAREDAGHDTHYPRRRQPLRASAPTSTAIPGRPSSGTTAEPASVEYPKSST